MKIFHNCRNQLRSHFPLQDVFASQTAVLIAIVLQDGAEVYTCHGVTLLLKQAGCKEGLSLGPERLKEAWPSIGDKLKRPILRLFVE